MIQYEAEFIELNSLAITLDSVIAAYARINIDDALFKHPELAELKEFTEENELEREAAKMEFNYVQLVDEIYQNLRSPSALSSLSSPFLCR